MRQQNPEGLTLYSSERQSALSTAPDHCAIKFGANINPENSFRYLPIRGYEKSVPVVAGVLINWKSPHDFHITKTVRFALLRVGANGPKLYNIPKPIVKGIACQPGKVLIYSRLIKQIRVSFAESKTNRILSVNMSNTCKSLDSLT